MNVDELIATAQPRTQEVRVCARGDLVERHRALVERLNVLVAGSDDRSMAEGPNPEIDAVTAEIEAVEAEQEEATVTFTLRSIGTLRWSNLLREHTPRPGQDHRLAFNLATFPPAAVAACVVEPAMTVEQAAKLYGSDDEDGALHSAEWDKLFSAAFTLNETETPHPKLPAAIGNLLRSGRSSTTAANGASLAPSSSEGNAAT